MPAGDVLNSVRISMLKYFIEKFSFPENPAVYAGLETLLILFIILAAGFLVSLINRLITDVLGAVIGIRPAFVLRNYLTYPGTVHHELSHALAGLITGARVESISLIPKGNELGSVKIVPQGNLFLKSLQLSLTAIAPVVTGCVNLCLMWRFLLPLAAGIWQKILFWYLFISILFHMSMSGADYKNFFKGLLPSVLSLFILFLLLSTAGIVF